MCPRRTHLVLALLAALALPAGASADVTFTFAGHGWGHGVGMGQYGAEGYALLVDLDLSAGALPAGTRLAVGTAVVELSATPHTGCARFSARFGSDALRWINTPEGREQRRRGANARVIQAGTVRVGDPVRIAVDPA